MRYKTGNNIKDRKNRPCDGYRNIDTAQTCIVMKNDKKIVDFIKVNADRLLKMKKNDKLNLLERHSTYGLQGSRRNVDYKELNQEILRIKRRYE